MGRQLHQFLAAALTVANGTFKDVINISYAIIGQTNPAPGGPPFSNATTDLVRLITKDYWNVGTDSRKFASATITEGQGFELQSGSTINISTTAGVRLNAGAASAVVAGPTGGCGMWVNGGFLQPGLPDGSTTGCALQLGQTANPFTNVYANIVSPVQFLQLPGFTVAVRCRHMRRGQWRAGGDGYRRFFSHLERRADHRRRRGSG